MRANHLNIMKKLILFASIVASIYVTAAGKGEAVLDPTKAGQDFNIQGEYLGETPEGDRVGLNIVALGDGKFKAIGFDRGLSRGWVD